MRPVAFGEALPAGTRLTLFSDDKPDRFFTVIKFWLDETSGVALELKTSNLAGIGQQAGWNSGYRPLQFKPVRLQ